MTKAPVATVVVALLAAACLPAYAQPGAPGQSSDLSTWSSTVASQSKNFPGGAGGSDSRSEPFARSTMAPRDGSTIEVRVPNPAQAQPPYRYQSQVPVPAPAPAPRGEAAERSMTECLNDAVVRRLPLESCRR